MITPTEFNQYPLDIIRLFEELEAYILSDVSRRLSKQFEDYGEEGIPATAIYQIQALEEMGLPMKEIKKKIAETEGLAIQTVDNLFRDANIKSFEREKVMFELTGKTLIMSSSKKQIISNSIKEIKSKLLSFTGSLGMAGKPLEEAYHHALNTAYMQVVSGASDYVSAIKRQVKALADSGLQSIDYVSGHKDHTDVAVRRAVITGLKQTTNRISELNASEMSCDGYEISAHAGARPSHQVWQGRQFAIYDKSLGYPLYEEVVGDGMEEPNCRHSKWGIFLGITKPVLTLDEINELDKDPFTFSVNGKKYDSYKATQMQRSIERSIRKTKRRIVGYEAAGLEKDAIMEKASLRQKQKLYREFSKEAGLPLQRERAGITIPSALGVPLKEAPLKEMPVKIEAIVKGRGHLTKIESDLISRAAAIRQETGVSIEEAKETADAITKWQAGGYVDIRRAQTDMSYAKNYSERLNQANLLEQYIDRSEKWSGGDLFRGIGVTEETIQEFQHMVERGTPINMLGLSSWSDEVSVASKFALGGRYDEPVVFRLSSTSHGTSIKHISGFEESEILMSGNTTFKPVSMRKTEITKGTRSYSGYEILLEEMDNE